MLCYVMLIVFMLMRALYDANPALCDNPVRVDARARSAHDLMLHFITEVRFGLDPVTRLEALFPTTWWSIALVPFFLLRPCISCTLEYKLFHKNGNGEVGGGGGPDEQGVVGQT